MLHALRGLQQLSQDELDKYAQILQNTSLEEVEKPSNAGIVEKLEKELPNWKIVNQILKDIAATNTQLQQIFNEYRKQLGKEQRPMGAEEVMPMLTAVCMKVLPKNKIALRNLQNKIAFIQKILPCKGLKLGEIDYFFTVYHSAIENLIKSPNELNEFTDIVKKTLSSVMTRQDAIPPLVMVNKDIQGIAEVFQVAIDSSGIMDIELLNLVDNLHKIANKYKDKPNQVISLDKNNVTPAPNEYSKVAFGEYGKEISQAMKEMKFGERDFNTKTVRSLIEDNAITTFPRLCQRFAIACMLHGYKYLHEHGDSSFYKKQKNALDLIVESKLFLKNPDNFTPTKFSKFMKKVNTIQMESNVNSYFKDHFTENLITLIHSAQNKQLICLGNFQNSFAFEDIANRVCDAVILRAQLFINSNPESADNRFLELFIQRVNELKEAIHPEMTQSELTNLLKSIKEEGAGVSISPKLVANVNAGGMRLLFLNGERMVQQLESTSSLFHFHDRLIRNLSEYITLFKDLFPEQAQTINNHLLVLAGFKKPIFHGYKVEDFTPVLEQIRNIIKVIKQPQLKHFLENAVSSDDTRQLIHALSESLRKSIKKVQTIPPNTAATSATTATPSARSQRADLPPQPLTIDTSTPITDSKWNDEEEFANYRSSSRGSSGKSPVPDLSTSATTSSAAPTQSTAAGSNNVTTVVTDAVWNEEEEFANYRSSSRGNSDKSTSPTNVTSVASAAATATASAQPTIPVKQTIDSKTPSASSAVTVTDSDWNDDAELANYSASRGDSRKSSPSVAPGVSTQPAVTTQLSNASANRHISTAGIMTNLQNKQRAVKPLVKGNLTEHHKPKSTNTQVKLNENQMAKLKADKAKSGLGSSELGNAFPKGTDRTKVAVQLVSHLWRDKAPKGTRKKATGKFEPKFRK